MAKGLKHLRPGKVRVPVTFGLEETQYIEVHGLSFKRMLIMSQLFYEEIEAFWVILKELRSKNVNEDGSINEVSPYAILTAFIENCPNLVDHVIMHATDSTDDADREMLQHLTFGTQFDIIDACGQATFNVPLWVGKAIETAKRAWAQAVPHLPQTNAPGTQVQAPMQEMDPDMVDRSVSPSGSIN